MPVLAGPLARSTIITANDLKLVNLPLESALNGVILDPAQIIGMQLTRALNANDPIKIGQLRSPKVIKRGQQVVLVTRLNGLEVRSRGKAQGDAATGEHVAAINLVSGKRVEGIALADGTVDVQ